MASAYWKMVQRTGFEIPTDRTLSDLSAELTEMLGSPDAAIRDGIALPALTSWITAGVYDELLVGLGEGMVAGLNRGLGETDTDTVFRRTLSARVLATCLAHDNRRQILTNAKVLEWGDHVATWYLRERDTRGRIGDKGWAQAIAYGADAIAVLAQSPHFGVNELTVLLDVLADRLLDKTCEPLLSGEVDRMAMATMAIVGRNTVSISILEPWIVRIASSARALGAAVEDPYLEALNPQGFLRALFLQLSLAARPPQVRSDLLLILIDALRATNAEYLEAPHQRA